MLVHSLAKAVAAFLTSSGVKALAFPLEPPAVNSHHECLSHLSPLNYRMDSLILTAALFLRLPSSLFQVPPLSSAFPILFAPP